MGRPPKNPFDKVKKDAFSAPQYLVAAAKRAAGVAEGKDFSPWVVAAIEEKLNRDAPGLIEETRRALMAQRDTAYGVAIKQRPDILNPPQPAKKKTA